MTKFYVNDLDKWLYQNEAEIMECVVGTLHDSYYVETKRGFAGIYVHPTTCWTSNHYVEFSTDDVDVWRNWEKFAEEAKAC